MSIDLQRLEVLSKLFFCRSKLPMMDVLSWIVKHLELEPCSQNCRPWKFYGHFRVIKPSTKFKILQNCQPLQFYCKLCVLWLGLQTSAVLRLFFSEARHLGKKTVDLFYGHFSAMIKTGYRTSRIYTENNVLMKINHFLSFSVLFKS